MRTLFFLLILFEIASAEALFLAKLHPPLDSITVAWTPSISYQPADSLGYSGIGMRRIAVHTFSDNRPDPKLIGSFTGTKNDKPARLVTTSDNLPRWCADHFVEGLRQYGIPVSPDTAEYVVNAALDSFFVYETDMYRGLITLTITVIKPSSGAKWTSRIQGGYEQWGKTFRLENFLESYANSLQAACEEFVKALPACLNSLDAASGKP